MRAYLAVGLILTFGTQAGCVSTAVTEESVSSPINVRRTPLEPDQPPVESEWTVTEGALVGQLEVGNCRQHRSWTVDRTRTTVKTPSTTDGWLALAAGIGLGVTGVVWGASSESGPGGIPLILFIPSIVLNGVGVATLVAEESKETVIVERRPQRAQEDAPCLLPGELQDLGLVAKVGPSKLLPIKLSASGSVEMKIPPDVPIAPGSNWPVVVFRVPKNAIGILRRGQILGHVRIE